MRAIETVNMSGWNTSQVKHMGEMFGETTQLKELDLSNFDMGKVTTVTGMLMNSDIDTLILGPQTRLSAGMTTAGLSDKYYGMYTGRWLKDDIAHESSADFMTAYDGSAPGSYQREVTSSN